MALAPKTARTITVAEFREWMRIPHEEDDATLRRCLDAALSEYCQVTGRASDKLTEPEAIAVLNRAAAFFKYRGDDERAPDQAIYNAIRGAFNPNVVG